MVVKHAHAVPLLLLWRLLRQVSTVAVHLRRLLAARAVVKYVPTGFLRCAAKLNEMEAA